MFLVQIVKKILELPLGLGVKSKIFLTVAFNNLIFSQNTDCLLKGKR